MKRIITKASGLVIACATPLAMGFTFETENIRGSFDSTIAMGMGLRTESPGCNLITSGASGHHPPSGCLSPSAGIGDQGNMNYDKGDLFTNYLKGTHELLLKFPEDYTFMARGSWIRDFAATDTSGALSATSPESVGSDGLTSSARDDLKFKARLLDLWVSKSFDVGEQHVRARLGNQVINWGESLFAAGGINNTNAYDVMALSRPGTQLKEALLPAPMLSLASGLGAGVNIEAYWQFGWNKSEMPPVGSYWSTTHALGKGRGAYGYEEKDARDSGQWGISLRWQPQDSDLNLGLYVMRYHDKLPSLTMQVLDPDTFALAQKWEYPEDRMLYGISANMPIGDWAVGTELSYRPKDAVPLNPVIDACTSNGGKCWKDEKKFQWHLTGIYSLTPSNSPRLLDFTGASTGTLLSELVVVKYPGLHDNYNGEPISAGLNTWQLDPATAPTAKGNKTSSGISLDFSLTYDNTLIPGWQVTPGVFYSQSLKGRTPNLSATFTEDASSMNLYLNFVRNPASWQVSFNYAKFSGGKTPYDQLLRDRDYVGLVVSRTL
ncbi:hypothetical protein C4K23_3040 [Pseudomonas chlororaphis]|uniref:DUF1302 domain-containing protein n=2 Tax=Pseudomonas chlororaphis TaxID=587753 RepID=UPI0003D37370|nr:DUF1302 domain-containing protein [Pseudomonas chlororaphis]AZD29789.1 hypothetical protein C4K23_3040 [Pseudomonas chlororaphis]ETD39192.1 hypothetical protein U724_03245 [Pseudomonas chlororaphis subsp. aurantiaca PB-St2]